MGRSMYMFFQPRILFAGIEGNTESGQLARKKIRDAANRYDEVPAPHPDQGWFGDPGSLEWKQFAIPDTQEKVEGPCPFHASRKGKP